jgi:hypothetical protein
MAEKRDDAQRVDVPSIVHDREIWAPTVYVTASRDWLVEGYLQALDRFRAVDGRAGVSEKEAFWPLFEALNWAATIQEFDAQRGEPIEHRSLGDSSATRCTTIGRRRSRRVLFR